MAVEWDRSQLAYFIGLIAFVCAALVGQGELIREPWHHYISIVGIIGTAVSGYLLQPPRGAAQTRVDDPPVDEKKVTL